MLQDQRANGVFFFLLFSLLVSGHDCQACTGLIALTLAVCSTDSRTDASTIFFKICIVYFLQLFPSTRRGSAQHLFTDRVFSTRVNIDQRPPNPRSMADNPTSFHTRSCLVSFETVDPWLGRSRHIGEAWDMFGSGRGSADGTYYTRRRVGFFCTIQK